MADREQSAEQSREQSAEQSKNSPSHQPPPPPAAPAPGVAAPGVAAPLERMVWFAGRTGVGPEAASLGRLAAALAQPVPTEVELPRRVLEGGLRFLRRFLQEDSDAPAKLIDAQARSIELELRDGNLIEGARGRIAVVKEFGTPWAFLAIRLPGVSAAEHAALRLVGRQADGQSVSLLPESGSSAADGLIVGLITSAGEYQAALAAPILPAWQELGPIGPIGPAQDYPGGIGRVTQIDIHPADGQVLIAGAAGGGVWRTDDGGEHWRPLMDDPDVFANRTLTIGAVAFAPSDPSVIYAASGEDATPYDPAWPGVGIYRSSDGGATWPVARPVTSTRFSAIAVHPQDPATVYVAGNTGLHKSVDGGLHWSTLWPGRITDIVLDPAHPERVYIGVYQQGVYRTTTAGAGPANPFTQLVVDSDIAPEDHGYIKLAIKSGGAAGLPFLAAKLGPHRQWVYTSTDGGDTWTKRPNYDADRPQRDFAEWTSVVAVNPNDEDEIYAGQRFILRRSTDGGTHWSPADSHLHPDHQDLVFDPGNPSRIYLANDAGVYRSDAAGAGGSWAIASHRLNIAQLYDLDISQHDADIVAVGAQESGIFYHDGTAWTNVEFPNRRRWDGTRVAVDPTDPRIVYFSGQHGIGQSSLSRTLDGGASSQPLGAAGLSGDSPFVTIFTLDPNPDVEDPTCDRIIFLGGSKGVIPHLFRSHDAGQNWRRVESVAGGVETPFVPEGDITAIEFALSDPSIVYLGTSLGAVYRATNGGAATGDWQRIDNGLLFGEQISAISVHPSNPNRVWIVFGGEGVTSTTRPDVVDNSLRTSHVFKGALVGGNWTWTDASGAPSLPWSLPDVPSSAIVVDESLWFEVAYVGTDAGVFRTSNGGVTWTRLGRGLPRVPVTRLRLHWADRWLYAATMGRGAFRLKVGPPPP